MNNECMNRHMGRGFLCERNSFHSGPHRVYLHSGDGGVKVVEWPKDGEEKMTAEKISIEQIESELLDARQAAYQQDCVDWYVDHEAEPGITSNAFFRGWDAAVGGGFRRSEVPEASAEPKHDASCGERCNHCTICGEHTLYGSHCPDHPNRPEPQGEPSDALPSWERPEVVEAARLAYQEAYETDYDAEDCIVAALRSANQV